MAVLVRSGLHCRAATNIALELLTIAAAVASPQLLVDVDDAVRRALSRRRLGMVAFALRLFAAHEARRRGSGRTGRTPERPRLGVCGADAQKTPWIAEAVAGDRVARGNGKA